LEYKEPLGVYNFSSIKPSRLSPWLRQGPNIPLFWCVSNSISIRPVCVSAKRTRTNKSNYQASLSPDQAVAVLTDRISLIRKINTDVADWLLVRFAQWKFLMTESNEYRNGGKSKKLMLLVCVDWQADRYKMAHLWGEDLNHCNTPS
jgi:hypothetical protein